MPTKKRKRSQNLKKKEEKGKNVEKRKKENTSQKLKKKGNKKSLRVVLYKTCTIEPLHNVYTIMFILI